MQFFYLFSFVVAASYAAALPQPAGLSEKYSNNVDATLASGLEARSYQPGLNSYKESATLMSLERRDNSDGNGDGSDPLTLEDVEKIIAKFFTDDDFISENMAFAIDNVGDGAVGFYKNGELAGKEIGDPAGAMLARYIERAIYVYVALVGWIDKESNTLFLAMSPIVSEAEFSKIFEDLLNTLTESDRFAAEKGKEVVKAVSNILTKTGTVIKNVTTIHKSFEKLFNSHIKLFDKLRSPLKDFDSTKLLYAYISNVVTSLD
ncbi:hypothetical protein BASA62_004370, partial [Batrachochytrium salamandrivorans]